MNLSCYICERADFLASHLFNYQRNEMNTLTHDQAHKTAKRMQDHYGSFASAIACAYMLADTNNRETLLTAFADLFGRVHADMVAYEQFTNQGA
jgi:hypothetical protein